MNVVTHSLLPVIAAATLPGTARPGCKGLIAIGIAGAMPDILNPHITLEARMSSWSHGLPFFALFALCVITASGLSQGKIPLRLGLMICAAYLLHLVCDAISGGINWLHPVANLAWGGFWVHPLLWIPLDIICLLTCYVLFRWLPMVRALRTGR